MTARWRRWRRGCRTCGTWVGKGQRFCSGPCEVNRTVPSVTVLVGGVPRERRYGWCARCDTPLSRNTAAYCTDCIKRPTAVRYCLWCGKANTSKGARVVCKRAACVDERRAAQSFERDRMRELVWRENEYREIQRMFVELNVALRT